MTFVHTCGHSFGQEIILQTEKNSLESNLQFSSDSLLRDHISALRQEGYLGARIDSIIEIGSNRIAFAVIGPSYAWGEVNFDNDFFHDFTRIDDFENEKTIKQVSIEESFEASLRQFEDHGYPFASLELKDVQIQNGIVNGQISINPGPKIMFDSLVIKSEQNWDSKTIGAMLDLKAGADYSEKKIQNISDLFARYNFVSLEAPPQILFHEDKADVYLYINERKANRFDGILGFQPDNETGEIVFTGDINLQLKNILYRSESIAVRWKRLQASTQEILIEAEYPYLFGSNVGVFGKIDIYRRDTTFANTQLRAGLTYQTSPNSSLGFFIENWISSGLASSNLALGNVNLVRYGALGNYNNLDYPINPTKGINANLEVSYGRKTLSDETGEIRNLNQIMSQGSFDFFLPLSKRFVFKGGVLAGTKEDDEIFINELYRLGGLKSIRGFDEQSVLASSYSIFSSELRFLLNKDSRLQLFYDWAWYEQQTTTFITDTPQGFGMGFSFGTGAGVFSLNYALGKQLGNDILLRNGKVHFGFVNLF